MRALLEARHYRAVKNILLSHAQPMDFLGRYAFKRGSYPSLQRVCLDGREIDLQSYSWHDVLTINEIFFRRDYAVSGDEFDYCRFWLEYRDFCGVFSFGCRTIVLLSV